MTSEPPNARRIRQATEWAAPTIGAAEEVQLVLSMDPPPGGWPGERVLTRAGPFKHPLTQEIRRVRPKVVP